ncbi:MAG TPA: helix-turn-helix domain-containing protein [Trebonia sp.]|nr:helix-turn-helix domain-containing protein [Trebonia sp.]
MDQQRHRRELRPWPWHGLRRTATAREHQRGSKHDDKEAFPPGTASQRVHTASPAHPPNDQTLFRISCSSYTARPARDGSWTAPNGHARAIRFSTLAGICDALDCQPGDILTRQKPAR